jgi:diaminopimelate epimerase
MAKDYGPRPGVGRGWYKGHGLGNDYLVFEQGQAWRADPPNIARVCHRLEGVGGDGIVVLMDERGGARFPLRMFNPDGSEFERSGNGLRVLASCLHHKRLVRAEPFEVECGGDRIRMHVHGRDGSGRYDVEVEMGRAFVGEEAVALARGTLVDGKLTLDGAASVPLVPVSVGNPHAVVFADALADPFEVATLARLGPALATHRAFAHGTNVQLARARPPGTLDILIWERGVGPTTASGTSACATAVAAVSTGRLPPGEIEVRMQGGSFRVRVGRDLDVVLRGPVQDVTTGELSDGFVRTLDGRDRGPDRG